MSRPDIDQSDETQDFVRPSVAERHLGLIAALAGAVGLIAMCGSPAALWSYAAGVMGAIWAVASAPFG